MLVDVVFPIFAPSKEWSKTFKELDYDSDETIKKLGSPYVSNQHKELKIQDGIYYTGLNADLMFKNASLDIQEPYISCYDVAHKNWDYRDEHGMKFISLAAIAEMYKLAYYGDVNHIEYGVCDNAEQIINQWPHLESSKQRHFITMTPIYKAHQPVRDGWRWHKNGEYIGNHEIQCEYLYDEKEIEVVYVFHIYTLKPESGLGSIPIVG